MNETWQADLNTMSWQKLETPTAPENREFAHAMMDSCHERMFLYGGMSFDAEGYATYYPDVWEFNLVTKEWSKLTAVIPQPWQFDGGSITFDSRGHRILYFGGFDFYFNNLKNETWAYGINDNEWGKLEVTGTLPTPRSEMESLYDPVQHKFYIMDGGGWKTEGYWSWILPVNELYKLDLASCVWKKIDFAEPAPAARKGMAFVYAQNQNCLLAFGGNISTTVDFLAANDLWQFDLSTQQWHELTWSGDAATGLNGMAAAFDPVRSRILLSGGYNQDGNNFDLYEIILEGGTRVENHAELLEGFALHANYPNPFNASTRISFSLPAPGIAKLGIFNVRGQEVINLLDRPLTAGQHEVLLNGEGLDTGIYFCRILFGGFSRQMKISLVK